LSLQAAAVTNRAYDARQLRKIDTVNVAALARDEDDSGTAGIHLALEPCKEVAVDVSLEKLSALERRNRGDGNLQAGYSNRQLGALPGRRVDRKPLQPLFIHPRKIVFIGKDHRGTDDLVE
jgi:hypothetical protein